MIPLKSVQTGIELSLKNTQRLLDDAKLLFENKRYASAVSLGVLSLEELGKAILLLNELVQKKDASATVWKKIFRDADAHIKKLKAPHKYNKLLGFESEYYSGEQKINTIINSLSKDFNLRKQRGFYVDWIEGKWWSPTMLPPSILKSWSEDVIDMTEFYLNILKKFA
jgi:AbiV family abortive infection protein